MNRRLAPTALAVSALLVACSSSSHKATPTGQQSATQLKAMALAASDLPFGWAVSPPSTDSSVTAPCSAITSDASKALPAQAETDFQQSEDGPFLQQILASGTAQQVGDTWSAVRNAASSCAAPTAASGSDSTRLSAVAFPSYGDASYALQLTAVRSGVSYGGDVVVVRAGQVFLEVAVFGVGDMPASLVKQLVAKAVSKL
jgi:hypothetical protein